jgi:hypothetical protein
LRLAPAGCRLREAGCLAIHRHSMRALQPWGGQPLIQMGGRFGLPCLANESVTLLSVGKSPRSFPRFSGCLLQPLSERYTVLLSIALARYDYLPAYLSLLRPKSATGAAGRR